MATADTVLSDVAQVTSQAHGGVLPRLVVRALEAARTDWDGIDAVAISIGPGSFTGLRIGLSLAKGIAYAGNLPVVPVSTLEALAWAADAAPGETVWAILDARMREVYAASFVRTAEGYRRERSDQALSPATCAALIEPGAWVVGDASGQYPELGAGGARILSFATHHPRGSAVARLGASALANRGAPDVGLLEPVYVRPAQAELAHRPSR